MFFNEQGILNLDEMIAQKASYKKIMEDGIVTTEEIREQSDKILEILHNMETKYTEEQLAEIKDLLVESNVLFAIYHYHTLQELNK